MSADRTTIVDPDGRRLFRYAQARTNAPTVMLVMALCYLGLSAVSVAASPDHSVTNHIPDMISAVALLGVWWLIARGPVTDSAIPWLIAALSLVLVELMLVQSWLDPVNLGIQYALLLMIGYGQFTYSWAAMTTAAVPMLISYAVVAQRIDPVRAIDLVVLAGAALVSGAGILGLRLRTLNSLADSIGQATWLATHDPLTGLLNRRGVIEQAPQLCQAAQKLDTSLITVFIDIDGLKAVNDVHGHSEGDRVLLAAGQAVRDTAQDGDLVARWGGDEFVVLSIGDAIVGARLLDQIDLAIAELADLFDSWPGDASLGMGIAPAAEIDWEKAVLKADGDMYQRRAARRANES